LTFSGLTFLSDENIHPGVVTFMRSVGLSVATVYELGLAGCGDAAILAEAHRLQRAVLTHDADFGALAIAAGQPAFGIIYLRPGHIRPEFTVATIQELIQAEVQITPPFILIAARAGDRLRVRTRCIGPNA
jgi:predicted nuclease of predicted toxin-antitoxin system